MLHCIVSLDDSLTGPNRKRSTNFQLQFDHSLLTSEDADENLRQRPRQKTVRQLTKVKLENVGHVVHLQTLKVNAI